MKSVDLRDLLGGLLVASVGGAFAVAAQSFPAGGPGQVGPAYVPTATGLIAVGLGLLIAAKSLISAGSIPKVRIRPVLAVFASVAAFAFLIRSTGLLPALFVTVIVASIGSPLSRPIQMVPLAAAVAVGCWLVFVVALGLPFAAFTVPF